MKLEVIRTLPPAVREKEIKAARGFEAVFIKEMMKLAMPSGNREEALYGDCLADALSQEAAKGRGIGLADLILDKGLGAGLKSAGKMRIT